MEDIPTILSSRQVGNLVWSGIVVPDTQGLDWFSLDCGCLAHKVWWWNVSILGHETTKEVGYSYVGCPGQTS